MLLNRHCFLSFGLVRPEPEHLLGMPDVEPCGPRSASVILLPSEAYTVLVPFPVLPAGLGNAVMLVGESGLPMAAIGTNAVHLLPGLPGCVVEINLSIPEGLSWAAYHYRLMMSSNAGNLFSNRVWYMNSDSKNSALFSFRNTRPIGLIDYQLPALETVRNVVRLKCRMGTPGSETEKDEYEAVSTGQKVVPRIKTHSFLPFVCDKTDAFGSEGFRAMLSHRDITINGRDVTLKTGYAIGESAAGLSTGSFEVWDDGFAIVNHC